MFRLGVLGFFGLTIWLSEASADPRLLSISDVCHKTHRNKLAHQIARILQLEPAGEKRLRALRFAYLRASGKSKWILQNILLEEYATYAKFHPELKVGRPSDWVEDGLPKFIGKWLFLNNFVPETKEIVWIYSDKEARDLFHTGVRSLGAVMRASDLLLAGARFWEMDGSVFSFRGETSGIKKLLFFARDLTNPLARIIFPAPFHRLPSPSARLFSSLYQNPERELSEAEIQKLQRLGLHEEFLHRRHFLQSHSVWRRFRLGLHYLAVAARYLTTIAAINYGVQQMRMGLIDADAYMDNPQYAIENDEVRIITDLVPFPHSAIQIGNQVYSYGQTHVYSQSVYEYLHGREIQRRLAQLTPERETQGDPPTLMDSLKIDEIVRMTGLDRMPRSVQIVTLKLGQDERDQLKRHFELQVGKRYKNTTFVNDCSTMLLRGIESETGISLCGFGRFIDASPSQMGMYWAGLNLIHPNLVTDVYQVRIEGSSDLLQLGRNTWINMMESNAFIELFLINQAQRLFVDLRYDASELQNDDPEFVKLMEEVHEEVIGRWAQDAQIQLYKVKIERLQSTNEEAYPGQLIELKRDAIDYIDKHIERLTAQYESPETNRIDIFGASFELEWLKAKRKEFESVELP